MRAALIDQHATQDAGRKLADALERMIAAEEHEGPDDEDDDPDDRSTGRRPPAGLVARGLHAGHERIRGDQVGGRGDSR